MVSLSEAGVQLLETILPHAQEVNMEMTDVLTADEKETLFALLNKVLSATKA